MNDVKRYDKSNLIFDIKKIKNYKIIIPNKLSIDNLDILPIILSQKTNSVEGNTTNLIDAYSVVNGKKQKGRYKISEQKEIKNLYNLYYKIINDKNFKMRDKFVHYNMYDDIIDIRFKKGEYKYKDNYTTQNFGNDIINVFYIKFDDVSSLIKENNEYLNKINLLTDNQDKLFNLLIWHCNFETIHPFPDGNGRVGRVLLDSQLIKNGFEPLILSNEYKSLYFDINNQIRDKKFTKDLLNKIQNLIDLCNKEYNNSVKKLTDSIKKESQNDEEIEFF